MKPDDMKPNDAKVRMKRVLAACIGCLFALPVAAQFRSLPNDAERGYIQHVQEMVVSVDGQQLRLSPGGTIRNRQNMIIVPTALPREGALAEYLLDANGQILRVWTPEEAARPRKPKPRR
jgi:hypothetical protein